MLNEVDRHVLSGARAHDTRATAHSITHETQERIMWSVFAYGAFALAHRSKEIAVQSREGDEHGRGTAQHGQVCGVRRGSPAARKCLHEGRRMCVCVCIPPLPVLSLIMTKLKTKQLSHLRSWNLVLRPNDHRPSLSFALMEPCSKAQ